MNSSSYSIALGSKDRRALGTLIADGNTPQKIAKRAQVVLMTADGSGTMAIMRAVGVAKNTMKQRPANATHWSLRSMAAEMGISHTSVQRIWHEYGLKPHLVRGFKISNDPDFVAKVKDVVGLYLDPPENALVLAVDEKSQIQAVWPKN